MRDLIRSYRASLKAIEVEEPIDLAVHRPLAFLLAKLSERTPVSPNHLTLLSMSLGVAAGGVLLAGSQIAAPIAGALLFSSQVVDCSDGMLARMRKTSSETGRMLDGVADGFTLAGAVLGATWTLLHAQASRGWPSWLIVIMAVALTVHTSSLHTAAYDHYKNLHLALTRGCREEDLEGALTRRRAAGALPARHRLLYAIYTSYLRKQAHFLSWFDPATSARYGSLPESTPERAAAYRARMGGLLDVWRSLFGVGSLVFGFAFFIAIGHVELFLLYRLVFLNAVFFLWLMPAQRAASRAFACEVPLPAPLSRRELRPLLTR